MPVVQCKLCPVCDGIGTKDSASSLPKKRHEFTCDNCQGQRYVPLVTCRGCGRAAIEWDAEVPYCGRKECWERLVEVIDPDKPRIASYFPCGVIVRRGPQVWDPSKREFVDVTNQRLNAQEEIARAMAFGWCADTDAYD